MNEARIIIKLIIFLIFIMVAIANAVNASKRKKKSDETLETLKPIRGLNENDLVTLNQKFNLKNIIDGAVYELGGIFNITEHRVKHSTYYTYYIDDHKLEVDPKVLPHLQVGLFYKAYVASVGKKLYLLDAVFIDLVENDGKIEAYSDNVGINEKLELAEDAIMGKLKKSRKISKDEYNQINYGYVSKIIAFVLTLILTIVWANGSFENESIFIVLGLIFCMIPFITKMLKNPDYQVYSGYGVYKDGMIDNLINVDMPVKWKSDLENRSINYEIYWTGKNILIENPKIIKANNYSYEKESSIGTVKGRWLNGLIIMSIIFAGGFLYETYKPLIKNLPVYFKTKDKHNYIKSDMDVNKIVIGAKTSFEKMSMIKLSTSNYYDYAILKSSVDLKLPNIERLDQLDKFIKMVMNSYYVDFARYDYFAEKNSKYNEFKNRFSNYDGNKNRLVKSYDEFLDEEFKMFNKYIKEFAKDRDKKILDKTAFVIRVDMSNSLRLPKKINFIKNNYKSYRREILSYFKGGIYDSFSNDRVIKEIEVIDGVKYLKLGYNNLKRYQYLLNKQYYMYFLIFLMMINFIFIIKKSINIKRIENEYNFD